PPRLTGSGTSPTKLAMQSPLSQPSSQPQSQREPEHAQILHRSFASVSTPQRTQSSSPNRSRSPTSWSASRPPHPRPNELDSRTGSHFSMPSGAKQRREAGRSPTDSTPKDLSGH